MEAGSQARGGRRLEGSLPGQRRDGLRPRGAVHGSEADAAGQHQGCGQARCSVAATGKTITVVAGDTLDKLAKKHQVSGGWRALHQANQSVVSDPNVLYIGQELVLPR